MDLSRQKSDSRGGRNDSWGNKNDGRPSFAPPPYLSGLSNVGKYHAAFGRIEYLLKLGLQSTSVNIVSCHAINTPQQDRAFETQFADTIVLDSFLAAGELVEPNTIPEIIKHGGRIRLNDISMIFPTGTIKLTEPPRAMYDARDGKRLPVYEYLHCRVAVGRGLVVEQRELDDVTQLPPGYSSVKIVPDGETDAADLAATAAARGGPAAGGRQQEYLHEYIIAEDSRVYPDFVVHFTFDPEADSDKAQPTCEQCEREPASVFCVQDNAKLCDGCDAELHAASKVLRKHTRVSVAQLRSQVSMVMCKEHPTMPVQFFDSELHVPVCVHCRMSGSHSSGEKASHPLLKIEDAYAKAVDTMEREKAVIEEKRRTITAQMSAIEAKVQGVHANGSYIEEALKCMVQDVLQCLQDATQARLNVLLSDESELRRQLAFYEWNENFLNYQRELLDPVDFVQTYRRHSMLLRSCPSEVVHDGSVLMHPFICYPSTFWCHLSG